MTPLQRNVLRDIGLSINPASFTLAAESFERLDRVARESIAHWTKSFKALAALHRMTRRKSKGWRRHVRRMKARRAA